MLDLASAARVSLRAQDEQEQQKQQKAAAPTRLITNRAAPDNSTLGMLADVGLSGISKAGNFFDVPASMVRDVTTWIPGGIEAQNPFDQLLTPFSSENRVSGEEMLQSAGLVGEDTWTGLGAGIATEILLDPLFYFSLGGAALGPAGRAAAKAGLNKNSVRVANKLAGKAPGQAGKKLGRTAARQSVTPRNLIDETIDGVDMAKSIEEATGKVDLRFKEARKRTEARAEKGQWGEESLNKRLGQIDATRDKFMNDAIREAREASVKRSQEKNLEKFLNAGGTVDMLDERLGGIARFSIPFISKKFGNKYPLLRERIIGGSTLTPAEIAAANWFQRTASKVPDEVTGASRGPDEGPPPGAGPSTPPGPDTPPGPAPASPSPEKPPVGPQQGPDIQPTGPETVPQQPAYRAPVSPEEFKAISPNHARMDEHIEKLRKEKILDDPSTELMRAVFSKSDLEGYERFNIDAVDEIEIPGKGSGAGAMRKGADGTADITVSRKSLTGKKRTGVGVQTLLHELGHGFMFTSAARQADAGVSVVDEFKSLLNAGEFNSYFFDNYTAKRATHYTSNPEEAFAQLFSDSLLRRSAPDMTNGIIGRAKAYVVKMLEDVMEMVGLSKETYQQTDRLIDLVGGFITPEAYIAATKGDSVVNQVLDAGKRKNKKTRKKAVESGKKVRETVKKAKIKAEEIKEAPIEEDPRDILQRLVDTEYKNAKDAEEAAKAVDSALWETAAGEDKIAIIQGNRAPYRIIIGNPREIANDIVRKKVQPTIRSKMRLNYDEGGLEALEREFRGKTFDNAAEAQKRANEANSVLDIKTRKIISYVAKETDRGEYVVEAVEVADNLGGAPAAAPIIGEAGSNQEILRQAFESIANPAGGSGQARGLDELARMAGVGKPVRDTSVPATKKATPGLRVGGGVPPESGLVPTIVKGGKIYYGKPGQSHGDVIAAYDELDSSVFDDINNNADGFAGPDGRHLTREEAMTVARKEAPQAASPETSNVSRVLGESTQAVKESADSPIARVMAAKTPAGIEDIGALRRQLGDVPDEQFAETILQMEHDGFIDITTHHDPSLLESGDIRHKMKIRGKVPDKVIFRKDAPEVPKSSSSGDAKYKDAAGADDIVFDLSDDVKDSPYPEGFYSKLAVETEKKVGGKVSWDQYYRTMINADVKQEEIDDMKIAELFADGPKTKREIQEHIADNAIEIDFVDNPSRQFGSYQVPGGDVGTYREILIRRKSSYDAARQLDEFEESLHQKYGGDYYNAQITPEEQATLDSLTKKWKNLPTDKDLYQGDHFDPEVVAHLRVDDVTLPNGRKELRVQEVQSDWHQAATDAQQEAIATHAGIERKLDNGETNPALKKWKSDNADIVKKKFPVESFYRGSPNAPLDTSKWTAELTNSDTGYTVYNEAGQAVAEVHAPSVSEAIEESVKARIPDAPFKKSWHMLALKQVLKQAAEGGYDSVSIVRGSDIAKAVDGPTEALGMFYDNIATGALKKYTKRWGSFQGDSQIPGAATGTEITQLEGGNRMVVVDFSDGSREMYDTMAEAVEAASKDTSGYSGDVKVFKITDKMRNDLLGEGQPLYDIADDATAAGAEGLDEVADAAKEWRESGTDSPYFQRWFKGSKVVDGDGKPQPLYHGTGQDFNTFKAGGSNNSFIMLSDNPEYAGKFARGEGGNIMPMFARMENPLDLTNIPLTQDPSDAAASLIQALENAGVKADDLFGSDISFKSDGTIHGNFGNIHPYIQFEGTRGGDKLRNRLKELGYDGIRMNDTYRGEVKGTTTVVFDKNQIKSATGNRGTFDAASNDIRYDLADKSAAALSSSKKFVGRGAKLAAEAAAKAKGLSGKAPDMFRDGLASAAEFLKDPEVSARVADKMDMLGNLMTNNPAVRTFTGMFRVENMGSNTDLGQTIANATWQDGEEMSRAVRESMFEIAEAFTKVKEFDFEQLLLELDGDIYKARGVMSEAYNNVIRYLEDSSKLLDKGRPFKLPKHLEGLREPLDKLKQEMVNVRNAEAGAGIKSKVLEDLYIDYFPRMLQGLANEIGSASGKFGKIFETGTPYQLARKDFLKNIPGGTATINEISIDDKLSGKAWGYPNQKIPAKELKEMKEYLKEVYGSRMGGDYIEMLSMKDRNDQIDQFLDWVTKLDPRRAQEGIPVFGLDPITNATNRLEAGMRAVNAAGYATSYIAQASKPFTEMKDGMSVVKAIAKFSSDGMDSDRMMDIIIEKMGDSYTAQRKVLQDASDQELVGRIQAKLNEPGVMPSQGEGSVLFDGERHHVADVAEKPKPFIAEVGGDAVEVIGVNDDGTLMIQAGDNISAAALEEIKAPTLTRNEVLENFNIEPRVVDEAFRYVRGFVEPETIGDVREFLTSVVNMQKVGLTVPWPAFHVRNLISGQYNNYMGRAYDPFAKPWMKYIKPIKDADALMRGEIIDDVLEIPFIKSKGITDKEQAMRELRKQVSADKLFDNSQGLAGDVVGMDMASGKNQMAKGGKRTLMETLFKLPKAPPGATAADNWKPWKAAGVFGEKSDSFSPYRWGRQVGNYVEGLNRLAPYIAYMKQGYDPAAAAKRVFELQFDYTKNTPADRYMRTLFPFYSYTKNAIPLAVKQMIEHPGGVQAQTVRATSAAGTDEPVPDFIASGAAIPFGARGSLAEGDKTFITGLGLGFEDPFSLTGVVTGDPWDTAREVISRMNPIIKLPTEGAFGESSYFDGPGGGRSLRDMDPTYGRILTNLADIATGGKTIKAEPIMGSPMAEQVLASLPTSRIGTTARTLTDKRKYENPIKLFSNLLTGVRISDVSQRSWDAAVNDLASEVLKDMGARDFVKTYMPEYVRESMNEGELSETAALEQTLAWLADRAKQRTAEAKAKDAEE